MRVLVLTNLYPNPAQPHRAPFNRQQFRALAGEHEVRVIAPVPWLQENRAGAAAAVADAQGALAHVAHGVVVEHPRFVYTPKVMRGWYGRFLLRSVRRCFLKAVEEFRPDVVLGCWAYPDGWASVRLAREAGLPVVVKVHGSDVLALSRRKGSRAGTMEAIRSCDGVVVVSKHLAARVVELGAPASRVSVVYNGVDTELFRPGSREAARARVGAAGEAPLVLFVGNLVSVKGIDVLVDALAKLERAGQEYQGVLIGEGPLRGRLEDRVASLGLRSRIRFAGARPLHELPDWYRAAAVCVLPSHSEGIPNVLLEAKACGTPIVATNVGGIPEIVDRDALVEPGDAASLANRIGEALGAAPGRNGTPPVRNEIMGWDGSARALARALTQAITSGTTASAKAA